MPLVIVAFFTALMGVYSINMAKNEARVAVVSTNEAAAVKLWAYFDSLRLYRTQNAISSGSIADASITLPAGVVRDANWTNQIFDGRLWVYESVPSGNLGMAAALSSYESSHGSYVGFKSGASFTSYAGYATGITVPTSIPAGSLVVVTR